jgi:hypothetical protein
MAPALVYRETPTPGENRNAEVFAIAIVFLAIALVGLIARLSSKAMLRKSLQIDDYLLIWASVRHSIHSIPAASKSHNRYSALDRQQHSSMVSLTPSCGSSHECSLCSAAKYAAFGHHYASVDTERVVAYAKARWLR